jgi:predicted regulator of amino acid metabolism with ACT domain
MNINFGKITFRPYDEVTRCYHNQVEIEKRYSGDIEVNINDITVDFGFDKKYLTHTVKYPIEKLPQDLKDELETIYNKVIKYLEHQTQSQSNNL